MGGDNLAGTSKPLNGFVKIYRQLLDWEWYGNANVFRVFMHLLLKASFKDTRWQGMEIKRGQVVTSSQNMANELNLSRQNIRTALKKLEKTGEITIKSTNEFTVITVVKWRDFQGELTDTNQQINQQSTNSQPTVNQQLTNDQPHRKNVKNVNNVKECKEGEEAAQPPSPYLICGKFRNVFLSSDEANELKEKYPLEYEAKLERLSSYMAQTGKSYKNHFATLLSWLEADSAEQKPVRSGYLGNSDGRIEPQPGTSYDIYELDKINTLDFISDASHVGEIV